jgi:TolA-binding protein
MSKWAFSLILAGSLASGQLFAAEGETELKKEAKKEVKEEATSASSKTTASKSKTAAEKALDEEWMKAIWTQVDDIVTEKEYKLQATVTVAGVRGAEAENPVLDKLYYKGAKRYPSQDKLKKAVDVLTKLIAENPKSADAPKQKFYVAQCFEKLGKKKDAKDYYLQLTKNHSKTPWAEKAQKALMQLSAAK